MELGSVIQKSVIMRARTMRERFESAPPNVIDQAFEQIRVVGTAEDHFLTELEQFYAKEQARVTAQTNVADEQHSDSYESRLEALGLAPSVADLPLPPTTSLEAEDTESPL